VFLGLVTFKQSGFTQGGPTVTRAARAIRPGEVVELTVDAPASAQLVRVRAFDRDWAAYRDASGKWHALVGIDLDTKIGTYDAVVTAGAEHAVERLAVARRVFPTRRLTVDPDLVHPPPDQEARVEREAEHLHELWGRAAPERLWTVPFERPVPDEANSAFGTRSIYNGEARPPHTGADFLSPTGRPVKAPNAGRVVLADPQYFSGNTVIIDHGLGLFSILAHLSQIDVKVGDVVTAGQIVGKVGATGRVTGPHLHWGVRLNNARVDPLSLLYVAGQNTSRERTERGDGVPASEASEGVPGEAGPLFDRLCGGDIPPEKND
jgi:murein DD-endopeptidase MepM/ murein hydrolase activator NlpD